MTPVQREEIRRYLAAFDFSGLFTDSTVGWDWPESRAKLRVPHAGGFTMMDDCRREAWRESPSCGRGLRQ